MAAKNHNKINGAPKGSRPNEAGKPATYFLSLSLENARCFGPKQILDLSDGNGRPAQWTILLGNNGTGKTTVLQSLTAFERIEAFGIALPRAHQWFLQGRMTNFLRNGATELR